MRLWSIHPEHLDQKGLVALWREGLLAKHVLEGKTKGYRNHPQLERFKKAKRPVDAIHAYLKEVHAEATRRGYAFDGSKFDANRTWRRLPVTEGQFRYETEHLRRKLKVRDPKRHKTLPKRLKLHPGFRAVPGKIEAWEKI